MLVKGKITSKHIFSFVMCLTLYKSAFGWKQDKLKYTSQIGSKRNLLQFGVDERKLGNDFVNENVNHHINHGLILLLLQSCESFFNNFFL